MKIEEGVDKLLEIKYQKGGWNMPLVVNGVPVDAIKIKDGEVHLLLEDDDSNNEEIHRLLGEVDDLVQTIRGILPPKKEVK